MLSILTYNLLIIVPPHILWLKDSILINQSQEKIETALDRRFKLHQVKGYFCSLLVSNILFGYLLYSYNLTCNLNCWPVLKLLFSFMWILVSEIDFCFNLFTSKIAVIVNSLFAYLIFGLTLSWAFWFLPIHWYHPFFDYIVASILWDFNSQNK